MSRIESLTPEQIAKFHEYVKRWTDIGLATAPANREKAEAAIKEIYRIAGLGYPKIVWCGSPFSQGMTRAIILDKKTRASVGASVRASVRDSVRDSVWDSVRASVGDSVRASVRDSVWDSVGASGYGQHDANWLAFYEFFRKECGLKPQTEKLAGLTELAKHAGWFLPHEKICWVSERHCILERDARGRLHSLTGPAVAYPDGWAIYAVRGTRVPSWIIETPEQITAEKIQSEQNAEVRRVMLEIFGFARYLEEINAKAIDESNWGILYRAEFPNDEPLVMVSLINSTAEPDGSFKRYVLRVPPDTKTARGAIAWTFNMQEKSYDPVAMS